MRESFALYEYYARSAGGEIVEQNSPASDRTVLPLQRVRTCTRCIQTPRLAFIFAFSLAFYRAAHRNYFLVDVVFLGAL